MGVSGAKEILSQWILHISATLVRQGGQQKPLPVLNGGHNNEDDPRHHSGFACHTFSFSLDELIAFSALSSVGCCFRLPSQSDMTARPPIGWPQGLLAEAEAAYNGNCH